jgi:hypothetical protein
LGGRRIDARLHEDEALTVALLLQLLLEASCRRCSSSSGVGWKNASPSEQDEEDDGDVEATGQQRPFAAEMALPTTARPDTGLRNRNGSTAMPREL